jgi:hypothetical protein
MRVGTFVRLLAAVIVPSWMASSRVPGYCAKGGPGLGAEVVSLIQLIANPQLYDKKRVTLIEYLHLAFEGNGVYLHREDFDFAIMKDAVWIHLPKDITPAKRRRSIITT